MSHFFNMSGHIGYISAAFGLSTAILILNFWLPIRQKYKLHQHFLATSTDESSP